MSANDINRIKSKMCFVFLTTGIMRVSFSQQATQYIVETRARAIIFNIGAFGADRTLHRRPSSLTPPRSSSSDQLQRSFRKEHRGLMSWPENIYAKQQQEINKTTLSLSERAMQLSIFGSMVKKISMLILLKVVIDELLD